MKRGSPATKWMIVFALVAAGGLLVPHLQWKGSDTERLPGVFQEIRAMGDLRTASVEASQVASARSTLRVPREISWMTGVQHTLGAISSSEAGVQVIGRIEAGVDLTQSQFSRNQEGILVSLPRARVFEGKSEARLLWAKESWVNRDRSLPLQAHKNGRQAVLASGLVKTLKARAEVNAEALIRRLLSEAGEERVTFHWMPDSQST